MSKKKKKKPVKKRKNTPIPSNKKKTRLEYPVEIQNSFSHFIETNIGPVESIIHSTDPNEGIHIDIFIVPPDEELPYWKLVTVGMSQYKQHQPDFLKEALPDLPDRSELVMLLEPEWTYDQSLPMQDPHVQPSVLANNNENNNYLWPIELLKYVASAPFYEKSVTFPGDIFKSDGWGDSKLNNILIKELQPYKTANNCLVMPNGETIIFYQAVAIDDKEAETLIPINDINLRLEKGEKLDNVLHPNRETIDLT